ncbi:MAG: nucleotide exchange factor GrpE [Hyphomicrobiaceae bacterium]|nr:nucleotide exchange factor GrpE [Hyphomicrobiaceae bacterium]
MSKDKKDQTEDPKAVTEPPVQEQDVFDENGELLPSPMELLETEIADLKDRYLRQAAEMDNLRKRTAREQVDTKKYAVSEFARDILSLSDNFQRAIDAVPPEAAEQDEALGSFLEGVKMNERELQRVLERHGVTPIDPKGEKFDPNQHQAVQQIDNSELPNDTVVDVHQVGYVISERVLRPAIVSVAKGGPKTASPHKEPPMSLPEHDSLPDSAPAEPDDAKSDDVGSTIDKNA